MTEETHVPMLPELAKAIAEAFPDLSGRAFAVSEVAPFKKAADVPTLPVAVVALAGETGTQSRHGGGRIKIATDLVVEFIFEPKKYPNSEGTDTPFYRFYDYEVVRNQLLAMTRQWEAPSGSHLEYKSMHVESDEFAVYISFTFNLEDDWCTPLETARMVVQAGTNLFSNLLSPKSTVPCVTCLEDDTVDPCNAARVTNP